VTSLFFAPFNIQLSEQLKLLGDLNHLYDSGRYDHALSIANRVAVIIEMLRSKDGGIHIQKSRISFVTPINPNLAGEQEICPLVSKEVYVNDAFSIVSRKNLPKFQSKSPFAIYHCNLAKWLGQSAFYFEIGNFLSRERLLRLMRNKDGASHPYSLVPQEYLNFAEGKGAISINTGETAEHRATPDIHLASMRLISHEIVESLSPSIPN
jgi:hypothetical protein